jgi:DNA-binding winged helix-turn-helix (wHTH) protein
MFGSIENQTALAMGDASSGSGRIASLGLSPGLEKNLVGAITPPAREPSPAGETLRFRRYSLTPGTRVLLRDQQQVPIGDRAFDLIYILASARGQVVERIDLMRRVWPTTVVEECNLRFQVRCARRALGDDGDMIKSVAGRGYFFVAESEPPADRRPALREVGSTGVLGGGSAGSSVGAGAMPVDPAGVQSPEDYRASCELFRELLTAVLQELRDLRGAAPSPPAGSPG